MKKHISAVLLGVAVAVSFAFGEVVPEISTASKAVLFSFSGLSALGAGAYNGGIGAKYYLMDPLAIRASLAFGTASQTVASSLESGGEDGENSGMLIGVSAGAEYHLTFDRVSPFFGGEINFSTQSTKSVAPINTANGPKVTSTNTGPILGYTPGNNFSISGIGGVEFFITNEISLAAEYQLGWQLPMGYKAKVKSEGATDTETTIEVEGVSRFGITNSGTLTLAVYF
jgi:hypothetical protein